MDGHPASLRELREALKAARPAVPVGKMSADDIKKELDYHNTAKKQTAAKEARLAALAKAREAKASKKAEPKKAESSTSRQRPQKSDAETKSEMFPAVKAKEAPKKAKKDELAELKKRLAELESD